MDREAVPGADEAVGRCSPARGLGVRRFVPCALGVGHALQPDRPVGLRLWHPTLHDDRMFPQGPTRQDVLVVQGFGSTIGTPDVVPDVVPDVAVEAPPPVGSRRHRTPGPTPNHPAPAQPPPASPRGPSGGIHDETPDTKVRGHRRRASRPPRHHYPERATIHRLMAAREHLNVSSARTTMRFRSSVSASQPDDRSGSTGATPSASMMRDCTSQDQPLNPVRHVPQLTTIEQPVRVVRLRLHQPRTQRRHLSE